MTLGRCISITRIAQDFRCLKQPNFHQACRGVFGRFQIADNAGGALPVGKTDDLPEGHPMNTGVVFECLTTLGVLNDADLDLTVHGEARPRQQFCDSIAG
jgi:hypothetical protein